MDDKICVECRDKAMNFCSHCKCWVCDDCYDDHHTRGFCTKNNYVDIN